MTNILIELPVYHYKIAVSVGDYNVDDFRECLKNAGIKPKKHWFKEEVAEDTKQYGGITYEFPDVPRVAIWVNSFDPGIIAHESLHAVSAIGRRIGLPHCEESEEFYCYTQQYLIDEILKHDS